MKKLTLTLKPETKHKKKKIKAFFKETGMLLPPEEIPILTPIEETLLTLVTLFH